MRSTDRSTPIASREWLLVAILTLVAGLLRAWSLSHAGLVQYDEGVYAFTGLGLTDPSQPHRVFPQQEKFSPPFYFSMVALSYLLGGASDTSAILVNVVLGTLTIPVFWFVARRWFGGAAAAGAATLLAFGPTHLTLSRTGLTDIAFALNFLVAIAALAWALETGGIKQAVLGGLATGLAWNTKYHGWFAGVIAIGAVLALHRRDRDAVATKARAKTLAIAACVAVVCYIPWTLYIRSQPGSVEGWSMYFATMLRINWPNNFWHHITQQLYLETAWSRASVPLALVAALFARGEGVVAWNRRTASLVLLTGVAAMLVGSFGAAALATIAAVPSLVRRGRATEWMLLTWLALWVVMAPIYHPYFRLLLPFCLAVYLGAGCWLDDRLATAASPSSDRGAAARMGLAMSLVVTIVVAVLAPWLRPTAADPWQRGDAAREAAQAMLQYIPVGARVTVVGEPALAFYLHRAGRPAFESPTPASLAAERGPGYLVTGVYSMRAPALRSVLDTLRPALDSLVTVPLRPNDLRLLDDASPKRARAYRAKPDGTFDLTLFRIRPRTPAP